MSHDKDSLSLNSQASQSDLLKGPGISRLDLVLTTLVALGYLVVTFWNLAGFPPYFFCDESIAGIDARSILQTGKDHRGRPWPIFFHGLGEYALSLSVYLQVPFVALIGLSEVAVRSRAAVMSVLGACSLGVIFSLAHGVKRAWIIPILLASSTFWYLHSRTGFEYMDAAACYLAGVTAFLYGCKIGRKRWFLLSGSAFGLSFYAYTPARGWVASLFLALALLAIFDRRISWRGLGFTFLSCSLSLIPFLWLQYSHPEITMQRFQAIRGERIYTLPLAQVIQATALNYTSVLNPHYWFFQIEKLHPRHSIPGFPLISLWLFPFWILGLVSCVLGWRSLVNRVILVMILTSPITAALFEISTARCFLVGVGYLLICAYGVEFILKRLPAALSILSAVAMCGYMGWFFVYTQTKALYTYPFYGMYGIQYGARQLYDFIRERLKTDGDIRVINANFNSGETHREFYLSEQERSRVAIIEPLHICQGRQQWSDSTLFVFPPLWFESIAPNTCPKFDKEVVAVIRDPRGDPLFEALRLKHSPEVDQWFEEIKRERLKPKTTQVIVNGIPATLLHTKIAWGTIEGLFDGDSGTRLRTDDINPGVFTLNFATTPIKEVAVRLDNTALARIKAEILKGGTWQLLGERDFSRSRGDSMLLSFPNPHGSIEGVRFTVELTGGGDRASVHLADIILSRP